MRNYFFNYIIAIVMIITAIITFTSDKLRNDNLMFIFAVIWISLAVLYTIVSTRNCLKYIHNCENNEKR